MGSFTSYNGLPAGAYQQQRDVPSPLSPDAPERPSDGPIPGGLSPGEPPSLQAAPPYSSPSAHLLGVVLPVSYRTFPRPSTEPAQFLSAHPLLSAHVCVFTTSRTLHATTVRSSFLPSPNQRTQGHRSPGWHPTLEPKTQQSSRQKKDLLQL